MSEETQRVVKTPKKTRENQNFEKFQAREKQASQEYFRVTKSTRVE